MALAIEVDKLEKTFKGGVRALQGVSFGVEEGTIFGLLGPNGAGKTTVVRVLTTILKADSGWAKVLSHDVAVEPSLVRNLFGLAGQYAAVDENLTGRENLMLVARLNNMPRGEARARASELLEEFQLTDAGDRVLKTYSGGMRRRLDLGAALVTRPRVLFLDEPTTGLDPQSRNDLWGVIENLVDGGTTVLLTTQYLEEADRLASHIAVVDHGQVISQGSPTELKASFGDTVLEVGFSNSEQATSARSILEGIGGHPAHVVNDRIELTLDNGSRDAMEALRVLDQASLTPSTFAVREPSLDDVFLSLTGRQVTDEVQSEPDDEQRPPRRGRRDR